MTGPPISLRWSRLGEPPDTPPDASIPRVDGGPWMELWYRTPPLQLALVGTVRAVFDRSDAATTLLVEAEPDADPDEVDRVVRDLVVPYAWAARGDIVLHGSAVAVDGAVLALTARSGTGKSTLASALAARGHALVADDAVHLPEARAPWLVEPTATATRLRADVEPSQPGASVPGTTKRQIEAVDLGGRATDEPLPLGSVVSLRRGPEPGIVPLSARDAFLTLHDVAFFPDRSPEPFRDHVARIAALARSIPTLAVTVPDDLDRLDEACDLVLEAARRSNA